MEVDQSKQAELAAAYFARGRKAWTKGDKDDALVMFRKALAIQESILGTYHKQTAKTYYWIGFALKHKNEYDKALVAYRRALRIRLRLYGKDDISTEDVHRAVNDVLKEKDYDDASTDKYFKAVVDSVEFENQGKRLADKGDYSLAIEEYTKCLLIEQSALGQFPLDIAQLHVKIAEAHKNKKDPDMAFVAYRDALVIYESKLGRAHPDTSSCLEGIRSAAYSRGMDETAVENYCGSVYKSIAFIKKADESKAKDDFVKAISEYESALDIEESILGQYPLTAAAIYMRIGECERFSREYNRSIMAFRTALSIFIFECGENDPSVIKALKEIGNTMKQKGLDGSNVNKYLNTVSYSVKYERYGEHILKEGEYTESIEEFQKSLTLEVSALGKYHLTQAKLFSMIGDAFNGLKKHDHAIVNYRNTLLIYQPLFGKSHANTIFTIMKMGIAAQENGMREAEIEKYREEVTVSIELEKMGDASAKKGKQEKAIAAFRRAIAIEELSLGQFHLCTAELYSKIANILKNAREFARSLVKFHDVLAVYQLGLGLDHPNALKAKSGLEIIATKNGLGDKDAIEYALQAAKSISLEKQGDDLTANESFDEALMEYGRAKDIEESFLGKSHLITATICKKIADVCRLRGQYNHAIQAYRDAVRIQIINNAPDNDDAGGTLQNLGLTLIGSGFNQKISLKYRKGARESIEHEVNGDTFAKRQDYAKALGQYRRAIAKEEAALGKLHPVTAILYKKIADICRDRNDYESAVLFYSKAFAIHESHSGKNHPDTIRNYNDLINAVQNKAASNGSNIRLGSEEEENDWQILETEPKQKSDTNESNSNELHGSDTKRGALQESTTTSVKDVKGNEDNKSAKQQGSSERRVSPPEPSTWRKMASQNKEERGSKKVGEEEEDAADEKGLTFAEKLKLARQRKF